MQVKDLTTEQFRALIREVVTEVLEEYRDPDWGKNLRPEVVERLLRHNQHPQLTISAEDALKTIGIDWDEL
ncbi:hypothetical protein [Pseudanabaena sp. PCC 6802]|uniref:hypothetical protein n=1 Tax=Pseudanabaena sp. PCC 6802 TaxID=118173 RepID=UPI00034BE5F8|nr:hypothetical protein [Pseudanabaena sp. PCC 6802]